MIDVSVVIPTCDRRARVLALLDNLRTSVHPIREVLVVDSSDQRLGATDLARFAPLDVRVLTSRKSVCVQRNLGIQRARGAWIFLCDDDVEVPSDYLGKLADHIAEHPTAGAVSGFFREPDPKTGGWVDQYPVTSLPTLVWRFIFQLGLWGEVSCHGPFADAIAAYYRKRGNHISPAGWPVLTAFDGAFFRTPVYSLGASVVKREWLLRSPFDESLDRYGIGDNYGVAIGFPDEGIHIVTHAWVHHHKEPTNRSPRHVAYQRRLFALDYFIRSRPELRDVSHPRFLASLVGAAGFHLASGSPAIAWATLAALARIARGRNPLLVERAKAAANATTGNATTGNATTTEPPG